LIAWNMLAFLGGLVFPALAAALHLGAADRRLLPWLVAAFLRYAATIVLIRAVNIPLAAAPAARHERLALGSRSRHR
jgi:hypothetical protein